MNETIKWILMVKEIGPEKMKIVEMRTKKILYLFIFVSNYQQMKEISHTLKPHLFLIDYHLPIINGMILYNQLHRMSGLGDVPVIITWTRFPPPEINQKCMERQIVGLKEPFHRDTLLTTIDQLTENVQREWK